MVLFEMLKIMNNNNNNNNITTSLSPHRSLDHVGNQDRRQRDVGEGADPTPDLALWPLLGMCCWDRWCPGPPVTPHPLKGGCPTWLQRDGKDCWWHILGEAGAFPHDLVPGGCS